MIVITVLQSFNFSDMNLSAYMVFYNPNNYTDEKFK